MRPQELNDAGGHGNKREAANKPSKNSLQKSCPGEPPLEPFITDQLAVGGRLESDWTLLNSELFILRTSGSVDGQFRFSQKNGENS